MAYLSINSFVDYVGSEIETDRTSLQMALDAAEAAVNDYCGRTFDIPDPAALATTRTYVPTDDLVIIHDISSSSGLTVTNNGATVASTAYQLEPPAQTWSGFSQPYYQIRMLSYCWYRYGQQATVSVTSAKWGWPAVPDQVVQATAILAKDIAHIRQNRFGVAGFGEYGVVRVRDNPHVTMLLSRLRHPMAFGIA